MSEISNLETLSAIEKFQSESNYRKQKKDTLEKYTKTFKVLSLFTGCGGFDLGVKGGFDFRGKNYAKNDFDLVLANDILKAATDVYKANDNYFGDHEVFTADIRAVDSEAIPDFDFMLAGFPCQPFSNAGLRKGFEDARGNLFEECERILKAKEGSNHPPKGFIFENVRGILSSKMPDGTSIPDEIVKRMDALGYNTAYKLLKASKYGVPSARYRVIIIGVKKEYGIFNFDLLDDIVRDFQIPNEVDDRYDLMVGSVLSDIPKNSPHREEYWKYSPSGQFMVDKIGPCYGNEKVLRQFKKRMPVEEMNEGVKKGRSWKNMDRADMSPRFQKIHDNPKKYRAPNFYRRFALAEINGTIIASAQPENCGITHPLYNRRYTIREIARIQSFPDDFKFPYTTITNAYKVIGNAVPPILGWVLGRGLQKHFLNHANQSS